MVPLLAQTILRRRRTVVASAPALPTSGLFTRYKASLEGLADNDPVVQLTDQSGNARHATQATSGKRAAYKASIVNSKGVYRFDAVTTPDRDYYSMPNAYTGLTAATIYFVVKRTNATSPNVDESGLCNLGTSGQGNHFTYTDGNLYLDIGSTVRKSLGSPVLSLATAFRVFTVTTASADWKCWIDRTSQFTTTSNTVGFPSSPTLGAWFTTYFLGGDLADFAIYNSAHDATARAAVWDYFASEYGTQA